MEIKRNMKKNCKFFGVVERQTKIIVIFFCISFVLFSWLQLLEYDFNKQGIVGGYLYKRKYSEPLPKSLKYVLLWTRADFSPFYFLENGQTAFLKNKCSHINCFVTNDRKFFGSSITRFDAIVFNGRNLNAYDLPERRSPDQIYIYMMTESAVNYPVCDAAFNNFFNWTATYRLDSDILTTYMVIRNMNGEIVGPKPKMQRIWQDTRNIPINESVYRKIQKKAKIAAWFASKCSSQSRRERVVKNLQVALNSYGLKIDTYGSCGTLYCERYDKACGEILNRDYFFYLAFENSFAVDYVTEKVITAMQNDVVPVVYGKADYSRFLPPGSYLKATKYNLRHLAAQMYNLSMNPESYSQFFKWKHYYTYDNSEAVENVCNLCAALNDEKLLMEKTYHDLRRWWNPQYFSDCK